VALIHGLTGASPVTISTLKVNAKRLAQAGFHPAPDGLESRHLLQSCPRGEIGRRTPLRTGRRKAYRFEACRGHQFVIEAEAAEVGDCESPVSWCEPSRSLHHHVVPERPWARLQSVAKVVQLHSTCPLHLSVGQRLTTCLGSTTMQVRVLPLRPISMLECYNCRPV
jgi:hypothetical protein